MATRNAPYRHNDGSNCYTQNCSLGHIANSIQQAHNGNVSGFLAARAKEDTQKTNSQPKAFSSLEYGSDNYKLFMSKADDVVNNITAKEHRAVMEYTGWAYQQYYSYLEGQNEDGTEFGSQYDEATRTQLKNGLASGVANMDNLMAKVGKFDKPVTVFRGEKPPKGVSVAEHLSKTYPLGGNVSIKRFLSTSMDAKVASEIVGENTDNSYVIVIKAKEGVMLGEEMSEHGLREKEVILPRDKKYRVENISSSVIKWGSTKRNHTTVHLTME